MTSVVSSSPRAFQIVKERRKHPIEQGSVPLGDQAEVIGVGVPSVVGERIKDLHKTAPVDLDIRHAGLHEPTAQQAALTERGLTISRPSRRGLSRQVKSGNPFGRGEQGVGSLLQVVPHLVMAGIGVALDAVQLAEQVAAVCQACRGQPVRQFQAGDFNLPFLGAADQTRVVPFAPGTSAVTLDRADAVADGTAGQ